MNSHKTVGFTIIETMLFLAISGALAVGILAGSSLTISTQRYKDSVNSFQSLLQQQYNEAFNVVNDRDNNFTCKDGTVKTTDASPGTPRGQSDCVIMGRYIYVHNGTDITMANVIGSAPDLLPTDTPSQNDIEELQRYSLSAPLVASNGFEETQVSWGASLYDKDDSPLKSFAILILRSPLSGTIRTFVSGPDFDGTPQPGPDVSVSTPLNLKDLVKTDLQTEKRMCLQSAGTVASSPMAVIVKSHSAGPTGIETLGEGNGCS